VAKSLRLSSFEFFHTFLSPRRALHFPSSRMLPYLGRQCRLQGSMSTTLLRILPTADDIGGVKDVGGDTSHSRVHTCVQQRLGIQRHHPIPLEDPARSFPSLGSHFPVPNPALRILATSGRHGKQQVLHGRDGAH